MSILKKYAWILIPVLFLLYSVPGALDYLFYFPDEKYYTDAVLQMMDKNDWLTPYKADGSPRFLKPIMTYWVLLGSYQIFGVSTFSSRVLFWLAGAFLTYIVYRMTLSLLKEKRTAVLAAFITAANPLVLMSASRSIPDILLVLFLTVSAWGFLEIMLSEKPPEKFYWMAYLGAALAFETKGLPAAAFAGISFLYLLFNPWKPKKLTQVIHPAAMITGVVVALSWFFIMYLKHGAEYLNSFFADQVGYRVSSKTTQIITNTFLGIINLVGFTLPWIIIVLSKPTELKRFIAGAPAGTKALAGFIALWVLAVVAMSGAVFKFYDRYLLPVIPLTSLFISLIIMHSETRAKKPVLKILLAVNLVVLFLNILYAVFISTDLILVAGTVIGISIFSFLIFSKNTFAAAGIAIANAILLLWFNVHLLLFTLLMPHPARQLTEAIQFEQSTGQVPVYVYGNIRMASGIRIYSGNQLKVISMDTLYMLPAHQEHLLVFNEKEKYLLDLEDHRLIKASEEWKRLPAHRFPGYLQPAIEKIKNSGTVYYIAKPKE